MVASYITISSTFLYTSLQAFYIIGLEDYRGEDDNTNDYK